MNDYILWMTVWNKRNDFPFFAFIFYLFVYFSALEPQTTSWFVVLKCYFNINHKRGGQKTNLYQKAFFLSGFFFTSSLFCLISTLLIKTISPLVKNKYSSKCYFLYRSFLHTGRYTYTHIFIHVFQFIIILYLLL